MNEYENKYDCNDCGKELIGGFCCGPCYRDKIDWSFVPDWKVDLYLKADYICMCCDPKTNDCDPLSCYQCLEDSISRQFL